MSKAQRNEQARAYVEAKLDKAEQLTEEYFRSLENYDSASKILKDLVEVKAGGFKGVVATAITGKYLNPAFDPLTQFYDCNPRPIFEQGIYYALKDRSPCGKSAPLNVAKNQYVLDYEWTNGKRPQSAAIAAVDYLTLINDASPDIEELLIDFFFFRMSVFGKTLASFKIDVANSDDESKSEQASRLAHFVLSYPESGTIPQFVVSVLLGRLYEHSSINLVGGEESVFGTNTTSKKPADIWTELDNEVINLYEVTVKKVDAKRLDDSLECLQALGMTDKPITFICRMPEDTSTLGIGEETAVNYGGKKFEFVDLRGLVHSVVALLSCEDFEFVIGRVRAFVQRIDRPMATKEGWNKVFSK